MQWIRAEQLIFFMVCFLNSKRIGKLKIIIYIINSLKMQDIYI